MLSRNVNDYRNTEAFDVASRAYGREHFKLGDRVKLVYDDPHFTIPRALKVEQTGTLIQGWAGAAKGEAVDQDGDVFVQWDDRTPGFANHVPALWLDLVTNEEK